MTNKFPHTLLQCLAAISQHHGLQINSEKIINHYALTDAEPASTLLMHIAVNNGLQATLKKLSWESLLDLQAIFPAIVRLNNSNGIIIVGASTEGDGKVAILDPLVNFPVAQMLTRDQLCSQWDGEVLVFKLVNPEDSVMIHREAIDSQYELTEILKSHHLTLDDLPPINCPISVQDLFATLNSVSFDHPLRENITALLGVVVHNVNLYAEDKWGVCNIKSWPNKSLNGDGRQLSNELFLADSMAFIDKKTPIVSMGSCFAVEIARWLQTHGYNYVVTENNPNVEGLHSSSCRWGVIFNTPGFYQTISRAFNNDMPKILQKTGEKYRDIFREEIIYPENELDTFDQDYEQHVVSARKALLDCKVLILTVGLNEVFLHLPTQRYLHRNPWNLNPFLWEEKVLTVAENVYFLRQGIELLRSKNKDVVILISVSPVPLLRSFQSGHVAVNTFHSKAVLRCAVEEVCNTLANVHYMPSFETVMYHGSVDPWEDDERHVNEAVISKIMNLFEFQFCKDPRVEINKTRYLESKVAREFFHNLPTELKNNAEMALRFESHANRLLDFIEKSIEPLDKAYLIMRNHYAVYGDVIDQAISAQIANKFPLADLKLMRYDTIFPYQAIHVDTAINDIQGDGYHFCPFKLNAQQIAEILNYYQENNEIAYALKFPVELIDNDFTRRLFMDRYFVEVAARFLDTPPIFESVTGFDTSAGEVSAAKLSEYAMSFHFDKDNIAWLNVFIYLDDITVDNGPHCYVPGSQKNRGGQLLRDGRFSDEEIAQYYGSDAVKVITGSAGTMFFANTHCLHKGTIVKSGQRRVLQFRYTNSMFGAHLSQGKLMFLGDEHLEALAPQIYENPRMYQNFSFESKV